MRKVVTNVKIYDLKESIKASGYPMKTDIEDFPDELELTEQDMKRVSRLVRACDIDNQAHGQFLTGIRVSFDLTFTNKAWVEAERYRFLEFVSSQSTMHRLPKFELDSVYCEYVDPRIIEIMKDVIAAYNSDPTPENYLKALYSNPAGFMLTARMTTNYRCLRNIYKQRKNHRLPEWKEFCRWIETLPFAKEMLVN